MLSQNPVIKIISHCLAAMLMVATICVLAGPGAAMASSSSHGDAPAAATGSHGDGEASASGDHAPAGVMAFAAEHYTPVVHSKEVATVMDTTRILVIAIVVCLVLIGFCLFQARSVEAKRTVLRLTVGAKLAIAFSFLVALLAITGLFSLNAIQDSGRDMHEVAMELSPLSYHMADIELFVVQQELMMAEAVIAAQEGETARFNELLAEYTHLDTEITHEFDAVTGKLIEFPAHTSELAAQVEEELNHIEKIRGEYSELHAMAAGVFGLLQQGDIHGAEENLHSLEAFAKEVDAEILAFRTDVNHQYEVLEHKAENHERNVIYPIIGIIILAVIIGLVVAVFSSNMIVKPIDRLSKAAHTMSTGDFSIILPHMQAKDAIARMNESFIEMKNNTRQLIEQVAEASSTVASASEELTASADETGKGIQQISQTVEEVARGSQETASGMGQSQENLSQTANAIEGISKDIEEIAAYATQASSQGEDGRSAANEAVSIINSAAKSVEQTADVVTSLGDKTQQIASFINIITGIADQTNLLALNAAIEAARAGEAGRGFAVVAEEVRKLAEESNEAAGNITTLVKGIEGEMQSALDAMQKSNSEVRSGAETVGQTSEMLGEIVGGVQALSDKVQNISASAQEVNAGTGEVVGVIQNVSSFAEQNSAATEELSATAEEQSAAMEQIASSSHQLADLAAQLQELVSKFKV